MIVVITSQELGQLLHQAAANLESVGNNHFEKLHNWLKKHHYTLQPTFPGIDVESMQVYFHLQPATEISEQEIAELSQMPGIEGAYRKAAEDLPG